jgi:endoglucanase
MTGSAGVSGDGNAQWRGVNLSSAEWGTPPGTYGMSYTYPTHAEVDRYGGMGMKILRFPFAWERLQPTINGALDATELGRLSEVRRGFHTPLFTYFKQSSIV